MTTQQLVRYDAMCTAIAAAYELDEVKDIRDRAIAMEHYHRLAHNVEAERQCCEIRLRATRKWRQLYDQGEKNKGGRPSKNPSSDTTGFRTLADHGVSRDEAARGAQLAALSDEEFEERLAQPGPLSTASLLSNGNGRSHHPVDLVEEQALWLWGRLQEFRREGILDQDAAMICQTMLPHMRETLRELLPLVIDWLRKVEP